MKHIRCAGIREAPPPTSPPKNTGKIWDNWPKCEWVASGGPRSLFYAIRLSYYRMSQEKRSFSISNWLNRAQTKNARFQTPPPQQKCQILRPKNELFLCIIRSEQPVSTIFPPYIMFNKKRIKTLSIEGTHWFCAKIIWKMILWPFFACSWDMSF